MKIFLLVLISFYFLNTAQCQKIATACFAGQNAPITGLITFAEKDSTIEVKVYMTGGHLDPYGVGNATGYVCDPNTPDKCEAGDLSGKHGKLQGTLIGTVTAEYTDQYISLNGTTTLENGVIGRAVVIHQTYALPGGSPARIACANIVEGN
ncbi:19412_t:CDS:2, partial [Gigaspora margarita]